MDGVLADFDSQVVGTHPQGSKPTEMFTPGFFRNLPVMEGAKEAVEELESINELKIYIATKITTHNLLAATEKLQWVEEHFPSLIKKVFIACDKTLLKGDFLIDDFPRWKDFDGEHILFNHQTPVKSWKLAVQRIKKELNR